MSNKPNPVALTAAMLACRMCHAGSRNKYGDWQLDGTDATAPASLASDLHRIASACQRLAVAECNGDFNWSDDCQEFPYDVGDGSIGDRYEHPGSGRYWAGLYKRINKRMDALNAMLAPLAIKAKNGGDPRGCVLRLVSTDPSRPLPGYGGEWPIA